MNHMLNDDQVDYVISRSSSFSLGWAGDMISELGDLADPLKFRAPIELGNILHKDAVACTVLLSKRLLRN